MQEHLITQIQRQLRQFDLLLIRIVVFFAQKTLSCKVLELALPIPWCLWHWRVDLFQIKLVLDCLLVDIGNHVGRFNKWQRK